MFLGAVLSPDAGGESLLILNEYMPGGNLEDYFATRHRQLGHPWVSFILVVVVVVVVVIVVVVSGAMVTRPALPFCAACSFLPPPRPHPTPLPAETTDCAHGEGAAAGD